LSVSWIDKRKEEEENTRRRYWRGGEEARKFGGVLFLITKTKERSHRHDTEERNNQGSHPTKNSAAEDLGVPTKTHQDSAKFARVQCRRDRSVLVNEGPLISWLG
jgi:hypothetical protein